MSEERERGRERRREREERTEEERTKRKKEKKKKKKKKKSVEKVVGLVWCAYFWCRGGWEGGGGCLWLKLYEDMLITPKRRVREAFKQTKNMTELPKLAFLQKSWPMTANFGMQC